MGLRLAFLGTPDFAVASLAALIAAGHEIACVYTRAPKPAGRGMALQPSPVQRLADAEGLPVRTPKTLRDAEAQAAFAALGLDAAVVAAYGLILPAPILAAPRLGCLNVHASLLPRWRGAAPIQRVLLAGDSETGITIMQMDEGLDTGGILLAEALPIGPETTAPALHDDMAALGARLIVPALDGLAAGRLSPTPQPAEGATYAAKLTAADGRLTWADADAADRQVRALTPWPGCVFDHAGERLKVLAAEPDATAPPAPPGTVLDDRLSIACAVGGAIRPTRLQRPGRSPAPADAVLRGFPIPPGTRLSP